MTGSAKYNISIFIRQLNFRHLALLTNCMKFYPCQRLPAVQYHTLYMYVHTHVHMRPDLEKSNIYSIKIEILLHVYLASIMSKL